MGEGFSRHRKIGRWGSVATLAVVLSVGLGGISNAGDPDRHSGSDGAASTAAPYGMINNRTTPLTQQDQLGPVQTSFIPTTGTAWQNGTAPVAQNWGDIPAPVDHIASSNDGSVQAMIDTSGGVWWRMTGSTTTSFTKMTAPGGAQYKTFTVDVDRDPSTGEVSFVLVGTNAQVYRRTLTKTGFGNWESVGAVPITPTGAVAVSYDSTSNLWVAAVDDQQVVKYALKDHFTGAWTAWQVLSREAAPPVGGQTGSNLDLTPVPGVPYAVYAFTIGAADGWIYQAWLSPGGEGDYWFYASSGGMRTVSAGTVPAVIDGKSTILVVFAGIRGDGNVRFWIQNPTTGGTWVDDGAAQLPAGASGITVGQVGNGVAGLSITAVP